MYAIYSQMFQKNDIMCVCNVRGSERETERDRKKRLVAAGGRAERIINFTCDKMLTLEEFGGRVHEVLWTIFMTFFLVNLNVLQNKKVKKAKQENAEHIWFSAHLWGGEKLGVKTGRQISRGTAHRRFIHGGFICIL